ncbi:IS630 family transposase [Yersinia similis]
MSIIAPIPRPERRLMQKAIHKTRDKDYARRLTAMLMLHRGDTVSHTARTLCAARSSVGRWINWFTLFGSEGLQSLPPGRPRQWPVEQIIPTLILLVQQPPQHFGWLRSRWSTTLLSIEIKNLFSISISISTVYRCLCQAGIVWRRAAPTLKFKDPHYAEKVAAIQTALEKNDVANPVFYEDEVDIDLNPKIGADWCMKGQQKRIATPGQNQKHYLSGTVNAMTGKVDYVSGASKNSILFINMLEKLRQTYRRAETITLILDNYVIHKSRKVEDWLQENPKFKLLFLPTYSPWLNKIELLWLSLHETLTRNHQCRYMWQLLIKVKQFMAVASPFPGNQPGEARV